MAFFLALCYQAFTISPPVLGAPVSNVAPQLAAAGGNLTTLRMETAPAWASSATLRGTADVLWSCLITLAACVYTAIHLNVPLAYQSPWTPLRRRMVWTGIALFAPEAVLYMAYKQFQEARKLVENLNKICEEKQKPGVSCRHQKYDLLYGFYALMGGFVTDVRDIHNTLERVTITAEAITFLAKQGYFLDILRETIFAKSKAGLIGKGLIIIQVVWMAIQCIARKAYGYPLSLLEVHTMVHVICALALYVLWWEKPQDVTDPTIVSTSDYPELVALILVQSHCATEAGPEANHLWIYEKSEGTATARLANGEATESDVIETIEATPQSDNRLDRTGIFEETGLRRERNDLSNLSPLRGPGDRVCELVTGQFLACGIGPKEDVNPAEDTKEETGIRVYLSEKDVKRWEYTVAALEKLEDRETGAFRPESNSLPRHCRDGLQLNAPNFSSYELLSFFTLSLPWFLLSFLYGGIHLTAWNFDFPSMTEAILWKVACFIILGAAILTIAISVFWNILWGCCKCLSNSPAGSPPTPLMSGLLMVLWGLMILSYSLSRVYIVAEAFLSLRRVPIGVYAAVPWLQNIPHI